MSAEEVPDKGDGVGGTDFVTSNDGNAVTTSATRTSGGGRGDNSGGNSNDDYGTGGSNNTEYIPVFEEQTFMEKVCLTWTSYEECLREVFPDATPEEIEEFEAIPAITITDLARFAPAGTPLSGEPDNLGVAGLPTNFVASASVQTQNGDLFGFPIRVRFTPATYSFHYGDGATDSGSEGGTSWASLGQAQFTPTDTSHTYAERGTYDARVDVAYTAEIDLGGGWFSIPGQLNTTGPAQEIRIFEAHTALVANTCSERPSAPGC
ncbi:hypothetical protein [Microbacterium istanbulense]|uniref:PKD domain-containing protein n=1 Tax=Microbacterium istanbulense TaxID=3122049 RepID=A0ABU8LJV7_9MICO